MHLKGFWPVIWQKNVSMTDLGGSIGGVVCVETFKNIVALVLPAPLEKELAVRHILHFTQ